MNTRKTVAALAAALFVALVFSACPSSPGGDDVTPPIITPPFMEMVKIPAGTFTMGSPGNEADRENNETQHQVQLSAFSIGKYQVTQKQYETVVGSLPNWITNPSNNNYPIGNNNPMAPINWFHAIVFCNKLSIREGLSPAYSIKDPSETKDSTDPNDWGTVPTSNTTDAYYRWSMVKIVPNSNGYRLPTEAQWEYACRAGTTGPFSTGNNITTSQANYKGTEPYNNNPSGIYREKTMPIGSFAPNAFGLYDMHGNVLEWCWDIYRSYSSVLEVDPTGPTAIPYESQQRVFRGGNWDASGEYLRSACRDSYYPHWINGPFGFRVARP